MIRLIFLFLLSACSENHEVENYGDINQTPGGITLIDPTEHAGGWGRSECLICHNAGANLHRNVDSVIADVEELNELIRNNGEAQYCLTCHGPNGIP